jgi:hypothetical protein
MIFNIRFGMFAATLMVVSGPLLADPSAIGKATAENGLVVDNSRASGNATVFEGSTIQAAAVSRIRLVNGTHLDLGAGSKAQVFAGHLALNTGTSEVQSASGFEIDTRTLRIKPADAHSIAKVALGDSNQVLVTAINSPVDVRNQGGVLVARVFPSLPMSFLPQAAPASGAAASTYNSDGCILDTGDSVVISDPTGRQVFELRGKKGANFSGNVGKRANVVGVIDTSATPKAGALRAAKGGVVQPKTDAMALRRLWGSARLRVAVRRRRLARPVRPAWLLLRQRLVRLESPFRQAEQAPH